MPELLEPLEPLDPLEPPLPPERDEPDIPPDDPDEPDEPDMPEPDEPDDPEKPDEPPLLDEPGDALRLLCPLIPERFVSPANSSEADDERLLLDALRELPSSMDSSPRMSRCDEEPD